MLSIQKCAVPPSSLLDTYSVPGTYADCYCTDVVGKVTFPDFVFAFYTTPLFKLERWILTRTIARPSTDDAARELATGIGTTFAAWHVEGRREHELLLCDLIGRTRSWLMSAAVDSSRTRLYFGSAVVPVRDPRTGKSSLGLIYRTLLGFHRIYSVLLLYSAVHQIKRERSVTGTLG